METQLDKICIELFKDTEIKLGSWVTAEQTKEFPYGCARFLIGNLKYSMNFLECADMIEVLKHNEKEDYQFIVENFAKHCAIIDPWVG